MDDVQRLRLSDKLDPSQFDLSVQAVLVGIGAEKYIDIFRKYNIGQNTLVELTDEDLIKLNVDNSEIREQLLNEITTLPIYDETVTRSHKSTTLGCLEVIQILKETSLHLRRILLSCVANSVTLKKSKNLADINLYKDKYASDIALSTVDEMNNILDSMDTALNTHFRVYNNTRPVNNNKLVVGAVGSLTVGTLVYLFVQSLKKL